MEIYEFKFCPDRFESNYNTVSVHRTKAGAYKAMRKYIVEQCNDWCDSRILYGKKDWLGEIPLQDCRWYIKTTTLMD